MLHTGVENAITQETFLQYFQKNLDEIFLLFYMRSDLNSLTILVFRFNIVIYQ